MSDCVSDAPAFSGCLPRQRAYGGRFGVGWQEEAGNWPEHRQGRLRDNQGRRVDVPVRWPAVGEMEGPAG